jgi:hypothetical protein
MVAAPAPTRIDNLEIPDRPAVASYAAPSPPRRRPIVLYGGMAAAALLVVVMMALLLSGGRHEVARAPADAPLIKAGDEPIKVPPESRGGMDVPNRDILVYGRMRGTPGDKPAIERLSPEPEHPLVPPAAPQRPAQSAPAPLPLESPLSSGSPSIEPLPAAPQAPSASLATKPSATSPAWSPEAPSTTSSGTPVAPATKPAPTSQVAQAPAVPATVAKRVQTEKQAKRSGVQVQLLSSRSADEARNAWARLKDKNGDLLGTLSPTVARADLGDRGTFYRLRAGPIADEAKARAICDSLAGRGASCIIVQPSR